jgi:hypothetical protein
MIRARQWLTTALQWESDGFLWQGDEPANVPEMPEMTSVLASLSHYRVTNRTL